MSSREHPPARRRPGCLLVLAAGLGLLAGCAGGPKRHHVAGEVLYDGKPVPSGEIYFDPDAGKGNDGPQGFARIHDGRYDTRQGGLAPGPGAQVVRIFGFDGKGRPDQEIPFGKPLFPEHKTAADVPDREATLDFQIPLRGRPR